MVPTPTIPRTKKRHRMQVSRLAEEYTGVAGTAIKRSCLGQRVCRSVDGVKRGERGAEEPYKGG